LSAFIFAVLEASGGAGEVHVAQVPAISLDESEALDGLLELARKALAVEAEHGEEFVGVDDVEVGAGARVGGAVEQFGFEERDPVEAPGGVGEFLGELLLGGRGGLVLIAELLAMSFEGFEVLSDEESGAAGESMGDGIARGIEFALRGAGAGGGTGAGGGAGAPEVGATGDFPRANSISAVCRDSCQPPWKGVNSIGKVKFGLLAWAV